MVDYGTLATIVAYAGNLGAAALAMRAAWAGKAVWEPSIQDFPKGPTRIMGAACIVGIAISFAVTRKLTDVGPLIPWAVVLGLVGLVGFLVDLIARTALIVRCEEQKEGIIGGLWLTGRAQAVMRGDKSAYDSGDLQENLADGRRQLPPASVRDLFCNSGRKPENIWPPVSLGVGRALIVLSYIIWAGALTLAVGCSSILIEKALSG